MVNVELLDETMNHIRNNPQKWRQSAWYAWLDEDGKLAQDVVTVEVEEVNSCGSAMCFAGHAALKSGFPAPPSENWKQWTATIDGKLMDVSDYAKKKLGLNWEQADVLFGGDNTMEDLETMVALLKENPDATEEDLLKAVDRFCDDDYCCEDCNGNNDEESW